MYWDTPDGRLRKARAALKLRKVGSRRTLTFKREVAYRSGISQRVEIVHPIRGPIGNKFLRVSRLEPVRRARRVTGNRPWVRALTLKTLRHKRIFSFQGRRIEMALDRVSVLQSNRRVAVYREVELENLDAAKPVFLRALEDLRCRFSGRVKPSRRSKYEIGLKLSRGKLC